MVGGQPKMDIQQTTFPDTDQDGIPDTWEQSHSLNAHKASDAMQIQRNGYTPLEDYFEDLVKK
jgi:hypothetical protein